MHEELVVWLVVWTPLVLDPFDGVFGSFDLAVLLRLPHLKHSLVCYSDLTEQTLLPQVAIKALSLKGLRDWKQLELFQREAVILEGLTHPNIPRYIDYFEEDTNTDRCFYIVQVSKPMDTRR